MSLERASGILLHPTSLPSRGGIGDFGPAAYEFIEFLAAARQGVWQVLPLNPIGMGNSPYSSNSAFAGNPLLISLERLAERGWLDRGRLDAIPDRDGNINYDEVRYEGYGINGAAVIVDCLTDNRVRTVADVRHAFAKYGGNLGTDGSVAFLFRHCGQLVFAPGTDENKLIDAALEAGADDVINHDDGSIEVITAPADFVLVKDALAKAKLKPEFAEVTMKPITEVAFNGDDAARMQKLLDAIEAIDDVQDVYTTAVIENA